MMSSNVFSGIESKFPTTTYMNTPKVETKVTSVPSKKEKVIKTAKTIAPYVIPLITIPITAGITYKLTKRNVNALNTRIDNLEKLVASNTEEIKGELNNVINKVNSTQKLDGKVWAALFGLAGISTKFYSENMSDEDKDTVVNTAVNRVNNIEKASAHAINTSNEALQANGTTLGTKYTDSEFSYGIHLLKNDGTGKNTQLYNNAINTIQNAAKSYLSGVPCVKNLPSNATIWSITSEFAPIKEGGLGSVPVEIQDNAVKLGVNMPTFIPMYHNNGVGNLKQVGDTYTYSYKDKTFNLKKIVAFDVDTFQGGKSKVEQVEIFIPVIDTTDEKIAEELAKKQLVFINNKTYFNGSIYNANIKTEEPEKFAFFSKAVYEFAKSKIDEKSVKSLRIFDKDALESIKAPDAFILNDWQASPVAALARYKAPMENAFGELSSDATEKLSNINIITIGHNATYQGSTRNNNTDIQRQQVTTNILNTLFDKFASDIVRNASSGATISNPKDKGLENIDNVLILNHKDGYANHTNLLNMGVSLSNYFHAKEIITEPDKAGELMWAMTQRAKNGSLIGIINGNDFNRLSIETKKDEIKHQTGLDFITYNKTSDIDTIISARNENKVNFYNNYMVPLSQAKAKGKLEFIDPKNNTILSALSKEELLNTPIISSVGRLVSQKGIDIMSDAIELLLKNWEKDFSNQNKPIFYLAGLDGEGGVQRAHIEKLKSEKLSDEDSSRVIFAHGFAPMTAISAASDFFLLPSRFEPCGLTQGESFAVATPVIGSAVGGIVDTVNRNQKVNGILTPQGETLTAENFYKAMKEGLEIYFNNPEKYKMMVNDSLSEDFSWIQKDKKGPVYDYLEHLGINRKELP